MELDLTSMSDGTIQAQRNISDSLWNDATNQAQILAWVKARGFDTFTSPTSSPSLGADITSMDAVHGWILSSFDEGWGKATGPAPVVAPTPATNGIATVGIVVAAAAVGTVAWLLLRR